MGDRPASAVDAGAAAAFSGSMTLHLIKLCVGCDDVADLSSWIAERLEACRRAGLPEVHIHRTRMTPKRGEDLLAGGSLYWVIKGVVRVREPILDLRPSVSGEGVPHCDIVLSGALTEVVPVPWRPFQGWRYLDAERAPADLAGAGGGDLPPALVAELGRLGLM
jgi:hypothetical protein